MHATFDMKHLYFYILVLLWYFTFSVGWPNISILCAMVDHKRFSVFIVDHWYQKSGQLYIMQYYIYRNNLIHSLYIWQ
jgi:hypothetical protein